MRPGTPVLSRDVARIPPFTGFIRRNILWVVSLGLILVVVEYAASVQRARGSVHGDWALSVMIGLSAALAPIAFITGTFLWGLRHPRSVRLAVLAFLLTLMMILAGFAGMMYTLPVAIPKVGPPETVTSPFQLAAVTFMIPVYAAGAAVLGLGPLLLVRWRRKPQ